MNAVFVNENELGHSSYLPPFVECLRSMPEMDVKASLLNATPLPPKLNSKANNSIRGLRRLGLDPHVSRWRMVVSSHVATQLGELRQRQPIDTVVVNTQSIGLDLDRLPRDTRLLVCLDATFRQLSRTVYFAPNAPSRFFLPLFLRSLLAREESLLQRADHLLAWSVPVRDSLVSEYGIDPSKVTVLPPSVAVPGRHEWPDRNRLPRLLFVGGNFKRKGGPLLLECYRRFLRERCELDIVTQSPVEAEPGVTIHRNVAAHTEAWKRIWNEADLFVFPSETETFGIVLVEALAFGVPVISAEVGAARMILDDGRAGSILESRSPESWAKGILAILDDRENAIARARHGVGHARRQFCLPSNTLRLHTLLSS